MIISVLILTSSQGYGARDYEIRSKAHNINPLGQKKGDLKSSVIIYRNGKLTVNMPSTTLNEAMTELSRITGIEVVWQGEEISKPVTLGFAERPVEETIEKILYGENYMLSYSSQDNAQYIDKITILPQNDMDNEAVSIAQSIAGTDMFKMNVETRRELRDMDPSGIERWNMLEEVSAISMLEDKKAVADQLMLAIINNPDAEARLLALDNLNELAPVQIDTLIETVSRDEDTRVKLRAIDYLVQRLEEDPRIEGFLASFLENEMLNVNQQF